MKRSFFFLLVVILGASSCTSGLRIEKRKYRSGFYVAGFSHNEKRAEDSAVQHTRSTMPEEKASEQRAPQTTAPAHETVQLKTEPAPTVQEKHRAQERIRNTVKKNIPQRAQKEFSVPPAYDRPVEAQKLNVMLWVAAGMLVLAVLLTLVAILGPFYWGLILLGAVPLLALAALCLSIWVTAVATQRRNFYATTDPETSRYYSKQRTTAMVVMILSIIATAICALAILLVTIIF